LEKRSLAREGMLVLNKKSANRGKKVALLMSEMPGLAGIVTADS
jgi:hypothetical protein